MKFAFLAVIAAALLSGCSKPDDAKITALEQRVASLETEIAQNKVAVTNQIDDAITKLKVQNLLDRLDDREDAGEISHEKAQNLRNMLTGKTPLYYVNGTNGPLTTNTSPDQP